MTDLPRVCTCWSVEGEGPLNVTDRDRPRPILCPSDCAAGFIEPWPRENGQLVPDDVWTADQLATLKLAREERRRRFAREGKILRDPS